ncbi:hypothetical protein [Veronia pacifica]|uniref:Uncharacterized protein n=1 Tax=Veronia pacifica TaxID=1080227 RepID=A0A1C3EMN7_9GAMM|nr:hypothetical protein [Veronia pacifica]ODA34513.1 hypothetical protein A8L45_05965 [Veronia pacifica]
MNNENVFARYSDYGTPADEHDTCGESSVFDPSTNRELTDMAIFTKDHSSAKPSSGAINMYFMQYY